MERINPSESVRVFPKTMLKSRAGRSPTFQDLGTPLFGLVGIRGFASPGPVSLTWTRVYLGTLLSGPVSLTWTRVYLGTPSSSTEKQCNN